MTNPDETTDDELNDPYVREVPAEKFIDDVEKASEQQASDEEDKKSPMLRVLVDLYKFILGNTSNGLSVSKHFV